MNPQIMAILQSLLGQGGQQGDSGLMQNAGDLPGMGNSDAGFGSLGAFSPVNINPNYAQTIQKYFNSNPAAGVQPYTGPGANSLLNMPSAPGTAGNNRMQGASSFMPNDFSSRMESILKAVGGN